MKVIIWPCEQVGQDVIIIRDSDHSGHVDYYGVYEVINNEEHHIDDFPTFQMAIQAVKADESVDTVEVPRVCLELL